MGSAHRRVVTFRALQRYHTDPMLIQGVQQRHVDLTAVTPNAEQSQFARSEQSGGVHPGALMHQRATDRPVQLHAPAFVQQSNQMVHPSIVATC